MKRKLEDKELKMVSGGFLFRGKDGSYIVAGTSDKKTKVEFHFKHDFNRAVKWDWDLFQEQWAEKKVFSLEQLMAYYNYGDFGLSES